MNYMHSKDNVLTIVKLDHQGRGIAYLDDKIVFIENALEDEKVTIRIIKETKKYIEAVVNEYIETSPKRVLSECHYFKECGGCELRYLNYEDTLEYKKKKVIDILSKYAHIDIEPQVIESDNKNHYRNKIEIKIQNGICGFYKKGTHECIEIKKCLNAERAINKFLECIDRLNLSNADVTIKSNYNDEIIVSINTNEESNIDIDYIKQHNKIVGIIWNHKVIYGESSFIEIIDRLLFRENYNSFFQINRNINSKLFSIVKDNVSNDDKVLELCSGVGTLSIVASLSASKVYAIEINENAVMDALVNAKMNSRDNINFILGDAYKNIDKIKDDIDTVIIDPPRSGLTSEARDKILGTNSKKIIYISCNPMTLARDLNDLKKIYDISSFCIMDMFPYTYHVESICVLERR